MKILPLMLAGLFALPVALTGCDRTIAEKTTTHTDSDGDSKTKTEKVTQDPAGNVTVTREEQKTTVDR